MGKLTEAELLARDAQRDIGAELLAAVRELNCRAEFGAQIVRRPARPAGYDANGLHPLPNQEPSRGELNHED